MQVQYKIGIDGLDWPQLFELYREVGLAGGLARRGEVERLRSAFEGSFRVITAWANGRLLGAGRLISDGVCYATIFDVAVFPEYQKQGIGKGIMGGLLRGLDHLQVHLTAPFESQDFYKKLGFRRHKTAYARYTDSSEYLEE